MDMEDDATARERSLPVHPVALAPFELATEEVDQASYATFLNDEWTAGRLGCETNDSGAAVSWMAGAGDARLALCELREDDPNCALRFDPARAAPFHVAAGAGRLPMVRVSWPGAAAYCNWRSRAEGRAPCYVFPTNAAGSIAFQDLGGFRLPTEAEWEWTATWDGARKRRYVWGDEWDPARANLAESPRPEDRAETDPLTLPVDRPPPWEPAGAQPPTPHLHLAGNAWEWCHDWYSDYSPAPAANPAGPATGEIKIVRGGSFRTRRESAWAAFRGIAAPETLAPDIGFRTARSIR